MSDDDEGPTPAPDFDLRLLHDVRATLTKPTISVGEQREVLYALTGILTRILHREQQRDVDGGAY